MIDQDYAISQEQIDFYRKNGFIQLDNVITGEALERLRAEVEKAVREELVPDRHRRNKTASSYEQLFIQKVNLWERYDTIKEFVTCRRFGNIAARLAGEPMRVWHDQALFKEPEISSKTPWHQDTHYWPHQQKKNQLSIWIALKDVDTTNGCMSFLPGTQVYDSIPAVSLGNPQNVFELEPKLKGIRPVTCPLKAGSCTFHNGLTFHFAVSNRSEAMREAFAILYMPDGTTYSGKGHAVIRENEFQVGQPLAGPRFPQVSDVAFEKRGNEIERELAVGSRG